MAEEFGVKVKLMSTLGLIKIFLIVKKPRHEKILARQISLVTLVI